jgi:hypothetical protein
MAFDPADVTPIDGLEPFPTVRIAGMGNARRFSHPER